MNNARIPVYSEQEHEVDIEEEVIEDSDISPHTVVIDYTTEEQNTPEGDL